MSIQEPAPTEYVREGTTVEDVFTGDVEEVLTTAGLLVGEYDSYAGYTISVVDDASNSLWMTSGNPIDLAEKQ